MPDFSGLHPGYFPAPDRVIADPLIRDVPGPHGVLVTGTSTAQGCCWLRCGSKPLAMRQCHSGEHRPTASNLGCSAAGGPDSRDLAWPRIILQKRPRESTGMSCDTSEHPGPAPGRSSDDAHGPGLGLARRVAAGR